MRSGKMGVLPLFSFGMDSPSGQTNPPYEKLIFADLLPPSDFVNEESMDENAVELEVVRRKRRL